MAHLIEVDIASAAPAAPLGCSVAAIVVLGAKVRANGQPSPSLLRRMQVAVAVYRSGVAPSLLLSGGGRHAVPEAEAMRRLALAAGVPESAIVVEPRSRNTLENAVQTAKLLSDRGAASVVLVTDRYHAIRSRLLFRLAGLAVPAVYVPAMPPRAQAGMLVAESIKLPLGVLRMLLRRMTWLRRG